MSTAADDPIARLHALVDGLQQQVAASDRELAAQQDERAEAAREGRLGPDWRAVQQRIDRGETTLRAVLGGVDVTPEAARLREQARENLARLAVEVEPPAEVVAELAAAEAQWERVRRGPVA
ncbi:hypothetical protein [Nocardioides aquiterrae]|uniref:Uncharacterized protein n=1 Tax=Nocardioides aquiterrae TaxID=203799 RepID=A0ABN1UNK5_9ACTN